MVSGLVRMVMGSLVIVMSFVWSSTFVIVLGIGVATFTYVIGGTILTLSSVAVVMSCGGSW